MSAHFILTILLCYYSNVMIQFIDVVFIKFQILVNAIRGIQNMVLATKMVDSNHLGSILAALKVCVYICMYSTLQCLHREVRGGPNSNTQ